MFNSSNPPQVDRTPPRLTSPAVSPLAAGCPDMRPVDAHAAAEVVGSGWLGSGPVARLFADELSRYVAAQPARFDEPSVPPASASSPQGVSAPSVLACSGATAALTLALVSAGVGPGDAVVVSPLTFPASANAVAQAGAVPVFVDLVESEAGQVDLDWVLVDELLSHRSSSSSPVAVMAVSWQGLPSDTRSLRTVAASATASSVRPVFVVEDGAYTLGVCRTDRAAPGSSCPVAVSFHPTKILTCGLGGALLGVSPETHAVASCLARQGVSSSSFDRLHPALSSSGFTSGFAPTPVVVPPTYQTAFPGFGFELGDVQAAVGLSQLARLSEVVARRRSIQKVFAEVSGPWSVSPLESHTGSSNGSMVVVKSVSPEVSAGLFRFLCSSGVFPAWHYPFLPSSPAWYSSRFVSRASYPVALSLSERCLTLPSSSAMSDSQVEFVAALLAEFASRFRSSSSTHFTARGVSNVGGV